MPAVRSIDETGNKYGDLVVEGRRPAKNGKAQWHCYCDACGGSRQVSGMHLRNGSVTHCGCKTPRDYPTVFSLMARIEKMEQAVAALQAGAPPAQTATAPSAARAPETAPAPAPALTPALTPAPAPTENYLDGMRRILGTPFEQRDIKAMTDEFRDLSAKEAQNLAAAKDGAEVYWEYDPDLLARHKQFIALNNDFKKFHIHPKDL